MNLKKHTFMKKVKVKKLYVQGLGNTDNLKYLNKEIVAYEFYNKQTGHCYVDYIERVGMGKNEGYEATALIKQV